MVTVITINLIVISHRRKSSVIVIRELLYTNLDSLVSISNIKNLRRPSAKRKTARKRAVQGFKNQGNKRIKSPRSKDHSGRNPETEPQRPLARDTSLAPNSSSPPKKRKIGAYQNPPSASGANSSPAQSVSSSSQRT